MSYQHHHTHFLLLTSPLLNQYTTSTHPIRSGLGHHRNENTRKGRKAIFRSTSGSTHELVSTILPFPSPLPVWFSSCRSLISQYNTTRPIQVTSLVLGTQLQTGRIQNIVEYRMVLFQSLKQYCFFCSRCDVYVCFLC